MLLACVQTKDIPSVTIGAQVWMAENLNVERFRSGDPIPEARTDEEWKQANANKQPAWCFYDNDPSNGTLYGKLYNWYAVNDPRGLAPEGWHVPTDVEWTIHTDGLGGEEMAGKKMKSSSGWKSWTTGGSKTCSDCESWNSEYRSKVPCHTCKDTRSVPAPSVTHSGNGSNSSGFSGRSGGFRISNGTFSSQSAGGNWWSATATAPDEAKGRGLFFNYVGVSRFNLSVGCGFSVRCLRD